MSERQVPDRAPYRDQIQTQMIETTGQAETGAEAAGSQDRESPGLRTCRLPEKYFSSISKVRGDRSTFRCARADAKVDPRKSYWRWSSNISASLPKRSSCKLEIAADYRHGRVARVSKSRLLLPKDK